MDRKILLISLALFVVMAGCMQTGGTAQSIASAFPIPGQGFMLNPASSSPLNVTSSATADNGNNLTIYCTNSTGSYITETIPMFMSN